MADDNRPRKLVTWQCWVWGGVMLVFAIAFSLWRSYKLDGDIDRYDLLRLVMTVGTVALLLIAVGYWANRPEKSE